MQLGKFTINLLDTGLFALDGGAMFGVVPKVMWSKAYNSGDELNRIPLAARPLLIQFDNKKILVDTGNGTKLNEKIRKIYNIDNTKSAIDKPLARFGLAVGDITDVILTHLHFDHSGGAVSIIDGKLIPTFPNAKFYVQKEHLKWALNPTEKDKASFFPENYVPLVESGLLDKLDGEGELFPGISVMPLNGHTKAMQLVKISDSGENALFCADLCATSAHIPIPYGMGYDNFPLTTIEEKKRILPQAYEENWTMIFEHDAFVQAGKIISTDKGFALGEKITVTKYE